MCTCTDLFCGAANGSWPAAFAIAAIVFAVALGVKWMYDAITR